MADQSDDRPVPGSQPGPTSQSPAGSPTSSPSSTSSTTDPLFSEFADDRDMIDLVQFFVGELEQRIGAMGAAWQAGDRTRLRSLAHQLKGAAGGYGYPSITSSAAALEATLRSGEPDASSVNDRLRDLVELCRRACAADDSRHTPG